MAVALVQEAVESGGSTTQTVTLPAPPTSGNLLVVFLVLRSTDAVGDLPQDGWTQVDTLHVGGGANGDLYAYYRLAGLGESATLSFTTPNVQGIRYASEWSGVGSFADFAATESTAIAATLSVGAADLVGSSGLAVGAFIVAGHGTAGGNSLADVDIDAPYTQRWYSDTQEITDPDSSSGLPPVILVGSRILSATGSQTMTATAETGGFAAGPYGAILLVFEAGAVTTDIGYWADWARDGFDDGSTGADDPRLARGLPQPVSTGVSDNITAYVMRSEWHRGASYDHASQAGPGGFTLYLDNSDGRFDPENTASPLYGLLTPGVPVWAGANPTTGAVTGASTACAGFLAGYIRELVPTVDATGKRVCEVIGEDAFGRYARIPVSVAPSLSRSHATFRALILEGMGESPDRVSLAAETGQMPFSAVDAGNGLDILDELNRATATRHFMRPADSKEEWYDYVTANKLHKLQSAADQALDGDDIHEVSGWRVTNDNVIEVQRATVAPIDLTPDNAEVWRYSDTPFTVTSTVRKVIWANFDDYVFDASVDYNVSSGSITATITNFGRSAKIEVWSASSGVVGLVRVLGRQVVRGDTVTVVAGSEAPGAQAGSPISSDYIGQTGAAQGLVDFMVWKFGQPLKRPNITVHAKNAATRQFIFERDLFDVVTIAIDKLSVASRRVEIVGLRGTHIPSTGNGHFSVNYELQETPNQSAIDWFDVNTDSVNGSLLIAPF